jgi:hypothetical protein
MGWSDSRPPKDYYIDAGRVAGIRVGSYLDVVRRVSAMNLYDQKPQREVMVSVGQLRVIFVSEDVAIARLAYSAKMSENPSLEVPAVMIGDLVRIGKKGKGPYQISKKSK